MKKYIVTYMDGTQVFAYGSDVGAVIANDPNADKIESVYPKD